MSFELQRPVRSIRIREREAPWFFHQAEAFETNAKLTPEQQIDQDARIEAHRVRVESDLRRLGVNSKVTREG